MNKKDNFHVCATIIACCLINHGLVSNSIVIVMQGCTIKSISKNATSITAQNGKNSTHDTGFSFINSMVTGSGSAYLGRPWGNYSQVVFSYTYMDKIVLPEGWEDWNNTKRYLLVL